MKCSKCNKDFEPRVGQDKCPLCGALIGMIQGPSGLTPPDTQAPLRSTAGPLWDDQGSLFERLWNTWKEVMFHPGGFFKGIPLAAGLGRPLVYAIIIGSIGIVFGTFYNYIWQSLSGGGFRQPGMPEEMAAVMTKIQSVIFIVMIVFSPLLVVIGVFIWSGILHLCLMIVGGAKQGFEATFRSVAYGCYSPMLLGVIPFCGGMVGAVWGIVLQIIGLKETHKISTGKAVLAFFLPLVFCCVCGVLLAIIGGAGLFTAFKSNAQPY